MGRTLLTLLLAALTIVCPALPLHAQADTGEVQGKVKVMKTRVKTEGPKSDRDLVIYLERLDGDVASPPPAGKLEMDQRGFIFLPHVLPVQKGGTVTFLNNDNELHNVYFLNDSTGETLDIGTWGYGVSRDHTFQEAGTMITLCKLHLEMAAYIVVLDTPYYTTAELEGDSQMASFTIPDLPPGRYHLTVWHKKLKMKGGEQEVTVEAGKVTEARVIITKPKYAR